MRREQLEHAIRTACQIIEHPEVIVVGSQSILGTFSEDELPAAATMSAELTESERCCAAEIVVDVEAALDQNVDP